MKLTNKILIAAFVFVLVATTALAVKLSGVIKYTPQPFDKTYIEDVLYFSHLKQIEISGKYEITVIKSEKDSLTICGPDLLMKKHTIIAEDKGKLKIESKVDLANYPFLIQLKLFARNLETITLKGGALVQISGLIGDSINILTKDSSIAKLGDCAYNYARLVTLNRSIVSLEKAREASVSLKNESMIVLNVAKDGMSGDKEPNSTLIVNGINVSNPVVVSNKTVKGR